MSSRTIIIVDDDPLVHFTLKKQISYIASDKNITSYTNPILLITFLEINAINEALLPDIIILDINMPLMDGLEFLDRYKSIRDTLSKQPRIYVSSSTADRRELSNATKDPNVAGVLSKPINVEELKRIL